MMTLESAIKHCEEVAEEQERLCKVNDSFNFSQPKWKKCAEEHRQLAEWLKELKQLRNQTKWIPVSELPKEDGNYLVTKEVYFTPNHVDDINHYRTVSISYYDTKFGWLDTKIYAWMPRPKAYEVTE